MQTPWLIWPVQVPVTVPEVTLPLVTMTVALVVLEVELTVPEVTLPLVTITAVVTVLVPTTTGMVSFTTRLVASSRESGTKAEAMEPESSSTTRMFGGTAVVTNSGWVAMELVARAGCGGTTDLLGVGVGR